MPRTAWETPSFLATLWGLASALEDVSGDAGPSVLGLHDLGMWLGRLSPLAAALAQAVPLWVTFYA
jgi:hypothetical protein